MIVDGAFLISVVIAQRAQFYWLVQFSKARTNLHQFFASALWKATARAQAMQGRITIRPGAVGPSSNLLERRTDSLEHSATTRRKGGAGDAQNC